MFIHAKVPPGVPTMRRLRGHISYQAESVDGGARVRIKTADPEALRAVHEFLQFQITDHKTGDSTAVQ